MFRTALDHVAENTRTSLLAFLVSEAKPSDATAFPWMHPQFGQFPPSIRSALEHARCFSELMHGAEPTPGDAIIVVVKADNCAGSQIAVSGRVVYGSGQGLNFACLQVQKARAGTIRLRRRNHDLQPLAGFINMNFIDATHINRAGVVE